MHIAFDRDLRHNVIPLYEMSCNAKAHPKQGGGVQEYRLTNYPVTAHVFS